MATPNSNLDGRNVAFADRQVTLGEGSTPIPERLLLAHARGEVLFIAGAGISQTAGLPDFRGLVKDVYARIDPAVHSAISELDSLPLLKLQESLKARALTTCQCAEIIRYCRRDYDVVLGMLEQRIDGRQDAKGLVRQAVGEILQAPSVTPSAMHRAIMRLSDRGTASAVVTTNFELLLERANPKSCPQVQTYSLGNIPRPTYSRDFNGVLHIHGAFDLDRSRTSDLVLTDRDFGEFYLRRRSVPDFIYDAARLFHLVLIGYSANDAPMKYLLNAVAADGTRFRDLKERFAFVGQHESDPIALDDWKGRGITPIAYNAAANHAALQESIVTWAKFSAINGPKDAIDRQVRAIVRNTRDLAPESARDLFDHLVRRGNPDERVRISSLASRFRADVSWLDAVVAISNDSDRMGST